MPNVALTKDEITLINDALEQAVGSAKRQQNMKGRTQTIKTVYEQHQRVLQLLQNKIAEAK